MLFVLKQTVLHIDVNCTCFQIHSVIEERKMSVWSEHNASCLTGLYTDPMHLLKRSQVLLVFAYKNARH